MADIKSPEERSLNMSKIKSKNTKPEEYIRKRLFEKGYRYRKNYSSVFGHPDIWIPKHKVAVFVNGCYWHRHKGCKYAYMPKSRVEFWDKKFRANIARDMAVKNTLEDQSIRMLIIWECTVKKMIKSPDVGDAIMSSIDAFVTSENSYLEI